MTEYVGPDQAIIFDDRSLFRNLYKAVLEFQSADFDGIRIAYIPVHRTLVADAFQCGLNNGLYSGFFRHLLIAQKAARPSVEQQARALPGHRYTQTISMQVDRIGNQTSKPCL